MSLAHVFAMSLAETFGNFHLKNFAASNSHHNLFCGIAGYCGVLYFLVRSFALGGSLLWVSAMWEGMITVLGAGFAIFVLGERFSHPIQYFGIFLAIVAMILVHLGDDMMTKFH
jgi:multidrug transporter EmrE-like cation transporter